MILTAGIDVGSATVKVAVMSHRPGGTSTLLSFATERYRRRPPQSVVSQTTARAFAGGRVKWEDLAYVATTGEGELAPRRDGHFFGMTTHARGALFLEPRARSVVDLGALHARAMRVDPRGRVLAYRMTSQCASGSGQFVENIARYLGVALEEVGHLSLQANGSEPVSGICAVLAETDVINMVARGVPTPAILRGIHEAIAGRLAKLLRACKVESPVVTTGGMAADVGLRSALLKAISKDAAVEIIAPEMAIYAGAIGAALWGAHRIHRGAVPVRQEPFHANA